MEIDGFEVGENLFSTKEDGFKDFISKHIV